MKWPFQQELTVTARKLVFSRGTPVFPMPGWSVGCCQRRRPSANEETAGFCAARKELTVRPGHEVFRGVLLFSLEAGRKELRQVPDGGRISGLGRRRLWSRPSTSVSDLRRKVLVDARTFDGLKNETESKDGWCTYSGRAPTWRCWLPLPYGPGIS